MKKLLMLAGAGAALAAWGGGGRGRVPEPGETAPEFNAPDQTGALRSLSELRGRWVVLYFYPKDDTPGCTVQACRFRDDWQQLRALGAEVVGVSVDRAGSHAEFAEKYRLPFTLLSDPGGEAAERYGSLWRLGPLRFARRNTFLISPDGVIEKVYLSASPSGNADQVVEDLKQLSTPRA